MNTPELDIDSLTNKVADACFYEDAGYVYLNPATGLCHNLTPEADGAFIRDNGLVLIWSRVAAQVLPTDDWDYACEAAECVIATEKLEQVAQQALAALAR